MLKNAAAKGGDVPNPFLLFDEWRTPVAGEIFKNQNLADTLKVRRRVCREIGG